MSTRQKIRTFLLLFVGLFSVMSSEGYCTGHAEGNGGSTEIQEKVREFNEITDLVIHDFNTWAKDQFPEFTADHLRTLKEQSKTYPVNHSLYVLTMDGIEQEVDAKNYPSENGSEPRIEFVIYKWNSKTILEKKALVVHEFWGLADVERNHFGSSARYKELLLERDNVLNTQFRFPLKSHVKEMGNAIISLIDPQTDATVGLIQDMKQSDLYKTATDAHPKSWYQFSSVTEEEQQLATRDLVEKISLMKVLGDTKGKSDMAHRYESSFQNWEFLLTEPVQIGFSAGQRLRLKSLRSKMVQEMNVLHASQLQTMVQTCFVLPIGQSIECAFEYWINYVSFTLPKEANKRKKAVQETIDDINRQVENYYE